MTLSPAQAATSLEPAEIAERLVRARLDRRPLSEFPGGALPPALAVSYAAQDLAIDLWPDEVAGWKVGRIPTELQESLGAERLCGPIFSRRVQIASGAGPTAFPVFHGGFTAVEAEFVYRLAADAPADRTDWTPAEALSLVDGLHMGVEIAASPLAAINILGPLAVASDFGNNDGLILGPELVGWRDRTDESLICATEIDGVTVGEGSAASLAGGPAASLAFLLNNTARRGRPLRRGCLVTTGAATGIHDIRAGQTARISFGEFGEILCVAQPDPAAASSGGNDEHDDKA